MNYLSATSIHNGHRFLSDDTVIAVNEKGQILDLLTQKEVDPTQVKHYEGILCPGFINAHCHLELSHLLHKIPEHTGLVNFALGIMKTRNDFTTDDIKGFAHEADKTMAENGIVAVGDICNTDHTLAVKQQSAIYYHSFIELISLNPARAGQVMEDGRKLKASFEAHKLAATLVPHAPYSVSYDLMQQIAGEGKMTSIHNQECKAESDFFMNKTGDFLKLYETIGLTLDFFEPTHKSSLQSYLPFLSKAEHVLLVHNTLTNHDDIRFAEESKQTLYWCLCPNANLYIEKNLPDIQSLYESKIPICLGTDSLASNHGLSIVSEINTISHHYPKMPLESIIGWATHNGALALGIGDRFGTLEKGKNPGINLLMKHDAGYSVQKVF
ncbi:MAG: amidohydrolase family protein [Bacteroidetes bacterium]|nr:amidohydrolase family protein [Bacteroidota bacterium]